MKKNTFFFIILLISLISILILTSCFFKEDFDASENEKNVIPLNIFQTWRTRELPPKMKESVEKLKKENPEFSHHLYSDEDCRNFIMQNFGEDVLNAYDSLIPGAFRADLWRYCILYKKGGVYLDVKYSTVNDFKLINLTNDEYFVRDIGSSGGGIYNAFMICKPGNLKLLNAINNIVENTKNKYYGDSVFDPTGPLLLKKQFSENELSQLTLFNLSSNADDFPRKCPTETCITMNDTPILAFYNEYREEQRSEFTNDIENNNYHELYAKRKIYN
jgi:mannosyltransferase OCH1-like enzyme